MHNTARARKVLLRLLVPERAPLMKFSCITYTAAAAVLASTAGKEASAKIAEAGIFVSTAGEEGSAKIAGAGIFASTEGETLRGSQCAHRWQPQMQIESMEGVNPNLSFMRKNSILTICERN